MLEKISLKSNISKSKVVRYIIKEYLSLYNIGEISKNIGEYPDFNIGRNNGSTYDESKEENDPKEKGIVEVKLVDNHIKALGE